VTVDVIQVVGILGHDLVAELVMVVLSGLTGEDKGAVEC